MRSAAKRQVQSPQRRWSTRRARRSLFHRAAHFLPRRETALFMHTMPCPLPHLYCHPASRLALLCMSPRRRVQERLPAAVVSRRRRSR